MGSGAEEAGRDHTGNQIVVSDGFRSSFVEPGNGTVEKGSLDM